MCGPTSRTDARHSGTIAVVWHAPWGINVSPIFLFRSPLPVHITEGLDLTATASTTTCRSRPTSSTGVGNARRKEIGDCETWNCGRGAWRTQLNLRVSKTFDLYGRSRASR